MRIFSKFNYYTMYINGALILNDRGMIFLTTNDLVSNINW